MSVSPVPEIRAWAIRLTGALNVLGISYAVPARECANVS